MTVDCKYFNEGYCEVASKLAGQPVVIKDLRACEKCLENDLPSQPNSVTASLAVSSGVSLRDKKRIHATVKQYIQVHEAKGAGAELSKILRSLGGFKHVDGCRCAERAREMNKNGVDWCSENIPLIVSWLEEEAARRNYSFVFSEIGATGIVKLAIHRARKKEQREADK